MDPFPAGAVDTQAILLEMGCTMKNGMIKTAIEKVTDGVKPSIAREVVVKVLSERHGVDETDARINDFADSLIDPDTVEAGREVIDEYSRD